MAAGQPGLNANCSHPLQWHNCYSGGYDWWVSDSYAHPAKMAPGLLLRILWHLEKLGLLKEGDIVLDFMAGIGTTLLGAALEGYEAIGVELENRFVELATQNHNYLSKKVGRVLPITIIQGDARRLSGLLRERGMVGVTSPPYHDSQVNPGNVGNAIRKAWANGKRGPEHEQDGYGTTPGQIGRLRDVPLKGIISPPYGEGIGHKAGDKADPDLNPKRLAMQRRMTESMTSRGNIANLPDRPLKGIVSPPYEDAKGHPSLGSADRPDWQDKVGGDINVRRGLDPHYGGSEGQIGQERAESYLEAMRQVYQQAYLCCDVLCVVTKNPTRNGKLRNLALDTFLLLKSAHNMLYCNCKTHQAEGVIQLDDGEWQIYQALLQQGPSMLGVRCTHRKQSIQMSGTLPEGEIPSRPFGGNEGQDTSEESSASLQPRSEGEADSSPSTGLQSTEEAALLSDLPSRDNPREPLLPPTLRNGRISADTQSSPQRPPQSAQGAAEATQAGSKQRHVAGRYQREVHKTQPQPQLAESQDAGIGEGQFHLPDLRQRGVHGSPQGTLGRREPGLPRKPTHNSVHEMPCSDGRAAPLCGVCGKPQVVPEHRVGFKIHCHHHALLFEEQEQGHLFEGSQKKVKGRLSFFKRLSYQKGSPVAQWEDILVATR